jgi:hypothetical protein
MKNRDFSAWVASLLLGAALLAAPQAYAQGQVEVNASAEPSSVEAGEGLVYDVRVRVEGGGGSVRFARLPDFGGLRAVGSSQGTEFRSVNGQTQLTQRFQFTLDTTAPGRVSIQGGQVLVEGKQVDVPPVTVEVRPAGAAPPASSGQPDANADKGPLFLAARANPAEPYVGQQVMMRFDMYYDEGDLGFFGVDVHDVKPPQFDGFWIEDLSDQLRPVPERKRVKGRDYAVRAVQLLAIFPLQAGEQTVGPMTMQVSTGGGLLSRGKTGSLRSEPLAIKVRELPAGAPSGFHKGNVGRWSFSAKVDKPRVAAGEPLTLRLEVQGQGMVGRLELPKLPERPSWRLLEPVEHKEVQIVGEQIGGKKVVEVVITPAQQGPLEIPSLRFDYFDPVEEKYKSLRSQPITIQVTGSVAPAPQQDVNLVERTHLQQDGALQQSLQPLGALRPVPSAPASLPLAPVKTPWFWLGLALPPSAYLGAGWLTARRRRQEAADEQTPKRAPKHAAQKLDEARARHKKADSAGVGAALDAALAELLAAKLGLTPGAITASRLRRLLPERGADPGLTERLLALRDRCERLKAGEPAEAAELAALISEAEGLLARVGRLS